MRPTTIQLISIFLLITSLKACEAGLYRTGNNTCRQCDISCNTCRSSDGCSTCYDQMYLVARGNIIVCDVCYNVNKGCDVCLTATKCQRCSVGFYLESDNTCSSCNNLTPGCLLCFDGNATYCLSCKSPLQLVNGVCVSNSSTTNSSRTAAAVSNSSRATTTTNSSRAAATTNSTTSAQGQTQTQSRVQSQSQSQGNTQQTQSQTQPNAAAFSVPVCDPSQISINGVCYPTIAFCLSYNQTDGTCTSCAQIFVLSNGYCLPSMLIAGMTQSSSPPSTSQTQTESAPTETIFTPCTSRQYFSDGACVDVAPQCTKFNAQLRTCQACSSGFEIFNGLCVQQAAPSTETSAPSAGAGILSSVILSANNSLPNCQTVNPIDTTKCLMCKIGYTFVDDFPGVCYQIN